MDFQSVNPLNVRLNLLSGNLLPMNEHDTSFSLFWNIYSAFIWMTQLIIAIALIPGCIYVPIEKTLKDGIICLIIFIEMSFLVTRMHASKNLLRQLIEKLNNILYVADEIMKSIVITTLKSVQTPLNFYLSGALAIIGWTCMPLSLIFKKDFFYYEDYRIPAVFSRQPFSLSIFLLGSFFLMISATYMFLMKVGVDVYMIHMILMTTAQYRYITIKNAMIFQGENEDSEQTYSAEVKQRKEKEIRALCRHHNALIDITSLLKQILSLNFSLIYINSVFRFCFIGIMLSTIPSTTFWEGILIIMYALGAVVQLYILCSCVQQLLDASAEITNKAFHEQWYQQTSSIKHIFMLIILANNLECKLARLENFNLSLPSFTTILNQSYSIAILLLRMK
ncbi:odorant receptor 22c-like [Linepithema humile]|uniref:odorant receptor 22c-like n=1 Tax=Linepithema humile TaxID=83485 RepID=UPI00351F2A16